MNYLKLKLQKEKVVLLLIVLLLKSNFGWSISQDSKISIYRENITLKSLFSQLEEMSNYKFNYGEDIYQDATTYKIEFQNDEIHDVMEDIAKKANLTFSIDNKTILVRFKNKESKQQEPIAIQGIVYDENNDPLPMVSVAEKGTNNGVITDYDGKFNIVVQSLESVLSFSFIGYEMVTTPLNNKTTLTIHMQPSFNGLNEVVVIGYGTEKKKDLTGAIASVKENEIKGIPSTDPLQSLKGKISGVDIYDNGHEPGSSVSINIRGQRSITASNSPLIILDGIPVIDGLNEINPNDVASIEVLKDASAAAIYGSRASNGVIIITTKRGKNEEAKISYNGYYGITQVSKKIDMMNGEQFAQLRREAYRTYNGTDSYPTDESIFDDIALNSIATGTETDWQDVIFNTGYKQDHQLSAIGGGDKFKYAISGNFYQEKGIVDNTSFKRFSVRANTDYVTKKHLKFGLSSYFSHSKQENVSDELYDYVLKLSPLGKAYDDNGDILFRPTEDEGKLINPLSEIKNATDEDFTTRLFASFYAQYEFIDGLSYKIKIGPDYKHTFNGYFYDEETIENQGDGTSAGSSNSETTSLTIENVIDFNKTFASNHNLHITLAESYQKQVTQNSSIDVEDIPFSSKLYYDLSAGSITDFGSSYSDWSLLSYVGRLNYKLKDKYLLTATARADGSSRLAENHKWGFFPSAALGWIMSEEDFIKDNISQISNLKLRVSYGETGNTAISPYETLSTLSTEAYSFGSSGYIAYIPSTLANEDLKWETTREFNVGLDFGLFDNKLTGEVNYYISKTSDLLLERSIPNSSGYETAMENIGKTQNNGIEVALNSTLISSKNFQWEANITFAKNNNKIVDLYGNGVKEDVDNAWFVGHPINVYYDYVADGVWQESEAETAESYGYEVGDIKVKDLDKDGDIDDDDRQIIGNENPKWTAGLTNSLKYKNLEFSFVLFSRQGNVTYSKFYDSYNTLGAKYNNLDVNYYTPENPTNENALPYYNVQDGKSSAIAYKKINFLKIRNIALVYSLPKTLTNRMGIEALKFNVTAQNFFTFTNYEGYDPEYEISGEKASYPAIKFLSAGVNVNF